MTREAVERAKLVAIRDSDGGQLVVRTHHLVSAAKQLVAHSEYINRKYDAPKPDMAILGEAIGRTIAEGVTHQRRQNDDDVNACDGFSPIGEYSVDVHPKDAVRELIKGALDEAGRPKNGHKNEEV